MYSVYPMLHKNNPCVKKNDVVGDLSIPVGSFKVDQ